MAGVRAVEGLVAKREVGNDVALDRRFEQRPLEPRWVAEMAASDVAIGTDPDPREDVASETLDEGKALPVAGACRCGDGNADFAGRQPAQYLLDQGGALLDLANPDPDARIHVAGLHH